MGRSEPRSARAVATARLFIGTLLTTQKEGLCHMEASSVLQQWKKLRGRRESREELLGWLTTRS